MDVSKTVQNELPVFQSSHLHSLFSLLVNTSCHLLLPSHNLAIYPACLFPSSVPPALYPSLCLLKLQCKRQGNWKIQPLTRLLVMFPQGRMLFLSESGILPISSFSVKRTEKIGLFIDKHFPNWALKCYF